MSLTLEREEVAQDLVLIKAEGEIDHHTFETLNEELMQSINEGVVKIVLDLSKITYISSTGLGALVGAMSEAEGEEGGAFVLFGMTEQVMSVFDSMGFTPMLKIADDREAAVAMAQKTG